LVLRLALSHVLFSFLKILALRLASNSLLAILLQQSFSLQQSFLQQFPFGHSFSPFSNLPPAILPFKSLPHPKRQKTKDKSVPAKNPLIYTVKSSVQEAGRHTPAISSISIPPVSSFNESFMSSCKQGGPTVLGEGCDIVTRGTCIPASLNVNNLGKAAVLHLPLLWLGLCRTQPTEYWAQLC
jgi:hypothetical protein